LAVYLFDALVVDERQSVVVTDDQQSETKDEKIDRNSMKHAPINRIG